MAGLMDSHTKNCCIFASAISQEAGKTVHLCRSTHHCKLTVLLGPHDVQHCLTLQLDSAAWLFKRGVQLISPSSECLKRPLLPAMLLKQPMLPSPQHKQHPLFQQCHRG